MSAYIVVAARRVALSVIYDGCQLSQRRMGPSGQGVLEHSTTGRMPTRSAALASEPPRAWQAFFSPHLSVSGVNRPSPTLPSASPSACADGNVAYQSRRFGAPPPSDVSVAQLRSKPASLGLS